MREVAFFPSTQENRENVEERDMSRSDKRIIALVIFVVIVSVCLYLLFPGLAYVFV